MTSTLGVTGCRVDTNSITLSFSDQVDQSTAGTPPSPTATSAANLSNYSIFAPNSGFNPSQTPSGWTASVLPDGRTVVLRAPVAPSAIFSPGEWVQITVQNVGPESPASGSAITTPQQISGRVPGEAVRTTRDVEDAVSYPILTEEIGYRPSPVGTPTGGGGGGSIPSAGGGSNLGQVALRAVGDVLGWKPNASDPKGFVGALTQAFTLSDVEGHVESSWNPRTFAVQTDLGGGITGAQASLYTRAKDALDLSLSLLDGLYPLDPEADPEYVKALREMARSQMTQIVKEFGMVGLPSILRIDTYFEILLGQHPTRHFTHVEFDPDKISGTLGELRDTYGIKFRGNQFNNSVEDEQDITNFRVISDYMTSLLQSWIANREFFIVAPKQLAFFGTQLVLISRQLNVIAETVNEVRFTLDSVFIGPNERQSLLLVFKDRGLPPMFVEDMLVEIENFVTNEGPQLLRDGGKISVTNNILPVVRTLRELVIQAHDPTNRDKVPDGYRTVRVRRSLDDLRDQLGELIRLTEQVEQQVPPPEDKLSISGVLLPKAGWDETDENYTAIFAVLGSGIEFGVRAEVHSRTLQAVSPTVEFYSAERINVTLTFAQGDLSEEEHDITIINPDGESATLLGAFYWDGKEITVGASHRGTAVSGAATYSQATRTIVKPRAVVIDTGGGGGPAASSAAAAPPASAPPPATTTAAPDAIAALQNRINEFQESHERFTQEIRAELAKLTGLFGNKASNDQADKEKS